MGWADFLTTARHRACWLLGNRVEAAWLRMRQVFRPQDFGIGVLFDLTADAVVVCNVETGRIELWSPAAERIFGYTADEALGNNVTLLIPERLQLAHTEGRESYGRTGRGFYAEAHVPIELPARDRWGREFSVELTLSPVASPPGADGHFCIAVIRDRRGRWNLASVPGEG